MDRLSSDSRHIEGLESQVDLQWICVYPFHNSMDPVDERSDLNSEGDENDPLLYSLCLLIYPKTNVGVATVKENATIAISNYGYDMYTSILYRPIEKCRQLNKQVINRYPNQKIKLRLIQSVIVSSEQDYLCDFNQVSSSVLLPSYHEITLRWDDEIFQQLEMPLTWKLSSEDKRKKELQKYRIYVRELDTKYLQNAVVNILNVCFDENCNVTIPCLAIFLPVLGYWIELPNSLDVIKASIDAIDGGVFFGLKLQRDLKRNHFTYPGKDKVTNDFFHGDQIVSKVIKRFNSVATPIKEAYLMNVLTTRLRNLLNHCSITNSENYKRLMLSKKHFIRLRAAGRDQIRFYMILPFVKGEELFHSYNLFAFKNDSGKSMERLRKVLQQLILGLFAIHSCGICHCDISLENVLFESQLVHNEFYDRCMIIDFGLAREYDWNVETGRNKSQLVTNFVSGKALYISLEMILSTVSENEGSSRVMNPYASDIWALGVVLFILCTGQPPFQPAHEHSNMIQSIQCSQSAWDWFAITSGNRLEEKIIALPLNMGTIPLGHPNNGIPRDMLRLMKRMLDPSMSSRITIEELVEDPYIFPKSR